MPILHGVNLSPFVRKTRVALAVKGIDYELVPVMPMGVSDEFKAKSPLGKIPLWEDGDFALPDSSCIIAYLEKTKPEPALYPSDPQDYGRALFVEEYGDTKVVETVLPFFVQRVINQRFMQKDPDEALLKQVETEKVPEVFDLMESRVPESGEGIIGGRFSVADIALCSPFVNAAHGGFTVDASRWPKLANYVQTVHANPFFKPLIEEEQGALAG